MNEMSKIAWAPRGRAGISITQQVSAVPFLGPALCSEPVSRQPTRQTQALLTWSQTEGLRTRG